jgi:hypothetical protein
MRPNMAFMQSYLAPQGRADEIRGPVRTLKWGPILLKKETYEQYHV